MVEFEATGEVLTIRQTFSGQDVQGHMRISTFLDGQLPDIAEDAQVVIDDYSEEYRRISPGECNCYFITDQLRGMSQLNSRREI